jgi:hypothetical protein
MASQAEIVSQANEMAYDAGRSQISVMLERLLLADCCYWHYRLSAAPLSQIQFLPLWRQRGGFPANTRQ